MDIGSVPRRLHTIYDAVFHAKLRWLRQGIHSLLAD